MALKILALEGLNNAKLCSLVEPILCSVEGVNSAQIDYLSQRLTMDINGRPTDDIIKDVMELLKQTFPGVRVRMTDAAVFKQPRLNTTPYRLEDDDYIDDELDEDEYENESESELDSIKVPWTRQLRERVTKIGTEDIIRVIFWASIGLSVLFLLLSGSWRDRGVAHPYLSAGSYFFALFSSLFIGENPRSDNWLIRVAAVASTLVTFIVGRPAEAVLAFLVYALGVMFVDTFYNRYEEKTAKQLVFYPQKVHCIRGEQTMDVEPGEVREGDLVVFEQGEILPFGGILAKGPATVLPFDETQPHSAEAGDLLQRGDKSIDGPITVSITEANPGILISSVRSMLLDNPLDNTALTSRARIWLAAMIGVGIAAGMIYYLVNFGLKLNMEGIRVLALLIAALLPCGLSAACQISQRGGLRFLSNRGILLGSVHLMERIPKLKKVVMNHIGFVTEGNMRVEEFVPAEGHTPEDVMEAAATVEALVEGDNPIANAIINYTMQQLGLENVPTGEFVEGFEVLEGYGIRGMSQDVLVMVGSESMMTEIGLEVPILEDGRMAIYVAIRGEYAGAFVLKDAIREESVHLIRELHNSGVEEVGLLTGYDGIVVRAATLTTGADSSYVVSTHNERRALLERLHGGDGKGRENEIAIIGPAAKVREFYDLCICLETGCLVQETEQLVLPREQEVQLAQIGAKEFLELLNACHTLNRILSMGVMILIVPKAFLIALVILWHIPLPVVYAFNALVSLLLYWLASSLFSEEKHREEPPSTSSSEDSALEDSVDYMS